MNRILYSLRAFVVALAAAATTTLALVPAAPRPASATSCVIEPPAGKAPPHVIAARQALAAAAPTEYPGGYERLVDKIRENRRAVREGAMTLAQAQASGGIAVSGTKTIPVIPVLYDGATFEPFNPDAMEVDFFAPWVPTSMNSYFREVSGGQLNVDGDVHGFQIVSGAEADYEDGDDNGLMGGGARLSREAVALADATVNYGLYDNDGPDGIANSGDDDGVVDIVFVMHPFWGGECNITATENDNIWSHHSRFTNAGLSAYTTNDARSGGGSIKVNRYCIVPSANCDNTGLIEIGVFCHEFGHALGIPDLYDTDGDIAGASEGIGAWGLMGKGNWNTPESPAHMTAFTKERLGWLTYVNVTSNQTLCLPPSNLADGAVAARLWTDGAQGPEYFVVENRQPIGFDANLPRAGLVIYHIDESRYDALRTTNQVNANERWKAVDVECADATSAEHEVDADDLDVSPGGNSGDDGDPWCASTQSTFGPLTIPDSRAYSNVATKVWVRNIGPCTGNANGVICADVEVGTSNPVNLCVDDCEGDNCNQIALCDAWWGTPNIWVDNNDNGFHDLPAAGIDNKFWFRVWNLGPDDAAGVTATLYMTPAGMGLEWPESATDTVGTMQLPIIAAGDTVENYFVYEYPDPLDIEGHYCLGLVVKHPQDPTVSTAANLSNNIAQINHQVLIQRAGTYGGKRGDCPGPFQRTTRVYIYDGPAGNDGAQVEVRLGSPPNFDDVALPAGWNVEILPDAGPYFIAPGQRDSVFVRVSAPNAAHGDSAHVPLTLWNLGTDAAIGGTVLDYRIDCVEPASPGFVDAEWVAPPGDELPAARVQVEWAAAIVDVDGTPEIVQHYEVFRSDNQGGPLALVGRSAIDERPDFGLHQWHDSTVVASDCPITYTYRVRAVDGAGNTGAFAPPVALVCPATGVEAPGAPIAPIAALDARPNPFQRSTTITFSLAESGDVEVDVFAASGRRVRRLAGGLRGAGTHTVSWDGHDDNGLALSSGVYFYRVRGDGISETRKIVLTR